MFKILSNFVGTGNNPEITVSNGDNLKKYFELNGFDEAILFIFFGIIIGIIIAFLYSRIKQHIKNKLDKFEENIKNKNDNQSDE